MSDITAAPAASPDPRAGRSYRPSRRWTRPMFLVAITMGLGTAVAALTRLPLAWDGAWFLVRALDTGTPTFLYRRAVHAVLQAPAIAVGQLTGDVALPALIFSATYAAVPLLGLAAAWRVVRLERPGLVLWPVLGIALVSLPGQVFYVAEGAIVVHLAWALVLAAALGRVAAHRPLVVAQVAAIAASHPFGGPAVAVVGAIAWIARRRGIGDDGPLVAPILVVVGVVVTLVTVALRSTYEIEASSLAQVLETLPGVVAGRPMVAVATAWLIGASTLIRLRARWRAVAVIGLLGLTAVALVPWALDPAAWATALRFRTWPAIFAAPLIALAAIDAMRRSRWADRRLPVIGAPLIMTIVLVCQAVSWSTLRADLAVALAAVPPGCVAAEDLEPVEGTPLEHWSVTSLALTLEGRDPDHLVVIDRPCADAIDGARVIIKLTPFERDERPIRGWWGFDSVVEASSLDP